MQKDRGASACGRLPCFMKRITIAWRKRTRLPFLFFQLLYSIWNYGSCGKKGDDVCSPYMALSADVLIVSGGSAGVMVAIWAKQMGPGQRVVVFEKKGHAAFRGHRPRHGCRGHRAPAPVHVLPGPIPGIAMPLGISKGGNFDGSLPASCSTYRGRPGTCAPPSTVIPWPCCSSS